MVPVPGGGEFLMGTYGFTILFAAFLMRGYLTLRSLIELKAPSEALAGTRE